MKTADNTSAPNAPTNGMKPNPPPPAVEVLDANGAALQNGDTVILIKDLKVKGSSMVIKQGTKVKGIRLQEGDHNIGCKIDGSAMNL